MQHSSPLDYSPVVFCWYILVSFCISTDQFSSNPQTFDSNSFPTYFFLDRTPGRQWIFFPGWIPINRSLFSVRFSSLSFSLFLYDARCSFNLFHSGRLRGVWRFLSKKSTFLLLPLPIVDKFFFPSSHSPLPYYPTGVPHGFVLCPHCSFPSYLFLMVHSPTPPHFQSSTPVSISAPVFCCIKP